MEDWKREERLRAAGGGRGEDLDSASSRMHGNAAVTFLPHALYTGHASVTNIFGTMGVTTSEGKFIFLFRTALFVGLGSVVATIIYLTPIPDQFPQSCRRRCHELDWPMICRVKMSVNQVPCLDADCTVSGLSVNHGEIGPTIQVCENDIVMVDVTNRAIGKSLSVHWRGQALRETPHMDGAVMITQCPIIPFTTFQYKFRASEAGTHFWQFSPAIDNLFGAFIVKQSKNRDLHNKLYDTDDAQHVISAQIKDNKILIVSSDQRHLSPVVLNVTLGIRHRFRVLFAGGPHTCRIRISIPNIPLLLLALDGHATKPTYFSEIDFAYGERVDFVMKVTNIDEIALIAYPEDDCESLKSSSIPINVLNAENSEKEISGNYPKLRTIMDDSCNLERVKCLTNIENAKELPKKLQNVKLDHKIYLFFGIRQLNPKTNATILTKNGGAPHINNKTMILPSSPIISQYEDLNSNLLCDLPCLNEMPCECVHILHIPLMDTVEIILIHQDGGNQRHLFHLHGNSFYIVGAKQMKKNETVENIMEMDKNSDLITRNLKNPIKKDSISVPYRGFVVLRLIASNPGYWLLDQELTMAGMQVLLHVGEASDLPKTPNNFPKCGSWVGPEFFLA